MICGEGRAARHAVDTTTLLPEEGSKIRLPITHRRFAIRQLHIALSLYEVAGRGEAEASMLGIQAEVLYGDGPGWDGSAR